MEKLLIPMAAGGLAFYYVTRDGEEASLSPTTGTAAPVQPPNEMGQPLAVVKTQKWHSPNSANSGIMNKPGTGILDSTGLRLFVDQRAQELEQGLRDKYDELASEAKKKGAEVLNETLKLNPPLKGNESYKQVSSRVGAVAGGAAGAAVCSATGVGAAAAPLCGIAGAYLGQKVAPVVAEYTKKAVKTAIIKPAKKVGKALKKLKFW